MGVNQSQALHIDVLGASNAGKTRFLDMLVFQGDTTLCATFGTYIAAYKHDGLMLEFCEYGGSRRVRTAWCDLWAVPTRNEPDALYVFINVEETPDTRLLQKMHGYLVYALSRLPGPRPLCIVYNERDTPFTQAFAQRISALFQLKLLVAQGWPVQSVTLQYRDARRWAQVVEIMFDWTVENAKR